MFEGSSSAGWVLLLVLLRRVLGRGVGTRGAASAVLTDVAFLP